MIHETTRSATLDRIEGRCLLPAMSLERLQRVIAEALAESENPIDSRLGRDYLRSKAAFGTAGTDRQ